METRHTIVFHANHRPKIITLCGSGRFPHAYQMQMLDLSLRGYVVLGVGMDKKADDFLGPISEDQKMSLDELHLRKIDMSDAIMVLNVEGYVGKTVEEEIIYAAQHDKEIRWLEPFVLMPGQFAGYASKKISTFEWLVQHGAVINEGQASA